MKPLNESVLSNDNVDIIIEDLRSDMNEEVKVIKSELAQAKNIIADAIRELLDSFSSLDNLSRSQKNVVASLIENMSSKNDEFGNKLGDISKITTEINTSVDVAIRSLQFEDIVRQLLEFIDKRIAGVEQSFRLVSDSLTNRHNNYSTEQVQELRNMQDNIKNNVLKGIANSGNPVSQKSMDEGDVELF